jgi:hypothetical protein
MYSPALKLLKFFSIVFTSHTANRLTMNGQGSEVSFYNGHVAVSQMPRFTNRYGPETMSLPPFDLPALPITDLTDPSNDDLGWLSSLPDSTQASTMPPLDCWDRPASTLKWCPPLTGSAIESGTPLAKNKRQGKALGSKAAMVCTVGNFLCESIFPDQ